MNSGQAGIAEILKKFSPVGLDEMNHIRLMTRIDSKYIFSVRQLPDLLAQTVGKYQILSIDHHREFRYRTVYLDTPEFLFYHQHINGKLPRYKIRYRIYENSGLSYLEIKCATSKKNTVKNRIKNILNGDQIDPEGIKFLEQFLPVCSASLRPMLTNCFNRLTLAGLEEAERITIDYNLSFSDITGKSITLPSIAVAELKMEHVNNQSVFSNIVKELNIRKTGFSKYCIGVNLLYSLPKQNKLKRKLLLISKIENSF